MKEVSGGVTAPKGFLAAGLRCGVKGDLSEKKDLALIVSRCLCQAAGVYTRNVVKASPVLLTQQHLADGTAWGIVANSGNANACAPFGAENALRMAQAAAAATGHAPSDFAVASTGVIGVPLPIAVLEAGIPRAAQALSNQGSEDAAMAILTTDTRKKEIAVTVTLDGKAVTIGAISKGSGMIHPNMGTMLAFVTTDCNVSAAVLRPLLQETAAKTFNRITVDGDTSTNDTCVILANGLAENAPLTPGSADYKTFAEALRYVCEAMARQMAGDGEGATRLVSCTVSGAMSEQDAETLARSVTGSSLTKAAMFGADANWGRVLCALGYASVPFDPSRVSVSFSSAAGTVPVCQNGAGLPFDEALAKQVLTQDAVEILVEMGQGGAASATCWGCDLTYDYVKINGDYRS